MNHTRSGAFNLTKVQSRLFDLLADGQPHTVAECLQVACGKRFAAATLIPTHIYRLRQRIARGGYRITSPKRGEGYQLVKVENADA